MERSCKKSSFINLNLAQLISTFITWIFLNASFPSHALFVSPPKDPIPLIHDAFPELTSISDKQGDPLLRVIKKNDAVLGYAFETDDIARIPAYSGEPVNMLVAINPEGQYVTSKVLEHHEP